MAKVLRTIAVVAGAVALIATGIGAVGGAAFAASALGGTIATVAQIAGVVAGVAGIGAQLLTKPPPARGSVTETIIDVNPPSPYGMGEGYFGGVLRHKVGYGPTLKKVPNPFLFEAVALCVAGPIAGPIVPQVDFGPVTSYYSGWLATDTRLGQRPDTALTAPLQANPTGWSSSHRLSSVAAIAWNHKFDKDGKIYASGLPTRGVVAKWALCYDPRKDSTRPGGSGSHRLGIETTYEWSENPALHAGTYAYGRFVNGKRVIGVGLPDEGIDWEGVAAWANDCQANGWRMFGFVFEGAADDAQRRWQNLRDICIAGGGEPLFSGAVLGFHWHRPRVPLDTVTEADLAEGPQEVTAMKSWRDRLNTVRPRYTSPAHNWSLVQAQQVQVASYLAEDGEERAEDIPFNFVKDVNQAAQLAAYWLTNSRELSPITLTLMPRLRNYRPGECLRLQLPELGLDHDAVILRREFDPGSMTVTLTLVTEDPAKHAFALGRTGTAPPTPSLTNSAEDRDTITREARAPYWPEVDGPGRPEDGATNTAPANANRVPLSRMEGDRGWTVTFNSASLPIETSYESGPLGRRFFLASANTTAADQQIVIGNELRTAVRLNQGERISLQARVFRQGTAAGTWSLEFWTFDASLSTLSVDTIASGIGLADPVIKWDGFLTVPPDGAFGRFELRFIAAGAGSVQLGITEPMVTGAAAGQTVHPAFTPGPNAVDGATRNTGALNADGLDSIDAGGPLFVGLLPPSKAEAGLINANVALGSNAVVNSDFTRGKFGWRWGGGGFEDQWGTNLPGWFGQRNVMWARVSGAFASGSYRDLSPDALWAGGTLANAPLFALAVNDADRLFAGVLAASHRCAFQLWILVFDGAGTLIQFEEAIGGLPGGAANGDPANFSRITRFSDVPTGGRWAIPMMRMLGNGENDPFIFFTEPMLAKVPSGQTGIPRYTPGRADSRGQPNSDILISGGVISGIGTANIFVDNARAVLQGLASARPAAGEYLNQVHFATDTLVASQWDGFNWRSSADITFAVSGPAEVKLSYRSDLTLISTLPVTATYQLAPAGASALTSGVTWAVSVVSGTFSGTAPSIIGSGSGQLRINSGLTSAEAQLRVTATVAGRNYPPFNVTVRREIAAPTSTPLTSFSTSSFTRAHAATIQVAIPSGVTSATLSAVAELQIAGAAPSGVTTCEGKWQRESSPGTWVDIGAVATSSPSPEVVETEFTPGEIVYVPSSGSITCSRTATGLTGGTTQNFRFVARVSAGNVRNVQMIGNASAQA